MALPALPLDPSRVAMSLNVPSVVLAGTDPLPSPCSLHFHLEAALPASHHGWHSCCLVMWSHGGNYFSLFLVSDFPLQFPAFIPGRSPWPVDSKYLPASLLWVVQSQEFCPKPGPGEEDMW